MRTTITGLIYASPSLLYITPFRSSLRGARQHRCSGVELDMQGQRLSKPSGSRNKAMRRPQHSVTWLITVRSSSYSPQYGIFGTARRNRRYRYVRDQSLDIGSIENFNCVACTHNWLIVDGGARRIGAFRPKTLLTLRFQLPSRASSNQLIRIWNKFSCIDSEKNGPWSWNWPYWAPI
jgi:hypothetical protein